MRPHFSVIIPAYNSEKYIRKGLDSIRAQTFTDYELIVVCDSCEDNTQKVAEEYGARTCAVNYHRDGLTRNHGMDMATGEWLLFMDDDDWFLHEYVFQQIADMAGKHDEDALIFAFISGLGSYCFSTPDNVHVPVWCKCWRADFVKDVRFSNRKLWSDCDFQNKVFSKPHKFVYWNMPMYFYNFTREGNQTGLWNDGKIARVPKPSFVALSEDWRKYHGQ